MSGKLPIPELDAFHKQRGKLVDCFALVETRLVQAIDRGGGRIKGDTFAGKIKSLRELKQDKLTEDIDAILTRLAELNALRTEIVHGTISLYDDDGQRYAVFSNARNAAKELQPVTRITHRGMRDVVDELLAMSDRISSV